MSAKLGLVSVLLVVFQGILIQGDDQLSAIDEAEKEACTLGLVDAATRTEDGSSYLFKGDYYWKIERGGVAMGYPRLITNDWQGVTGPVDAAITWNDGSTFIFKGDQYWRFVNREPEDGYPKKISIGFRGIPDNLDAAVVWQNNGLTYFFKGDKYWRYSPNAAMPTRGKYPAELSAWKGVPNNVTAAIRWEGGLTYFFKGTEYYKYDNDLQRVPRRYPIATGKAWFECGNESRINQADTFERENHHRKKVEMSDLMSKIKKIQSTLTDVYLQQLSTSFKLDAIKTAKESPVFSGHDNDEEKVIQHFELF